MASRNVNQSSYPIVIPSGQSAGSMVRGTGLNGFKGRSWEEEEDDGERMCAAVDF